MEESLSLKYSSGSQLKSHTKNHDMVLSLGRANMNPSKDETPTPTRFLKKCEEVGLFQDLKKVNPFEETFRKAAEAVTTSNVSSVLSLSRATTEDTLHTPHVFPHTDDDSRSKTSSMGDESMSEDMLDGGERVIRQEADTSILCNTPTPTLSTPIHPPFPLPGSQFLTPIQPSPTGFGLLVGGSNTPPNPNNELQLCLKVSHGTTLELAGNTLKILGSQAQQPVQPKPPNIILDTSDDMRTVIFASQQHETNSKQETNDVKQKLKNFLGHSKVKKSVSSLRKPSLKAHRESYMPTRRTESISISTNSSSSFESTCDRPPSVGPRESTSDDKIKILREKNRAAAMRCRERKKAWVAELGRRADYMSVTNRALVQEVKLLRAEVARLKALILTHKDCPVTLAANAGHAPEPTFHQSFPEEKVPAMKREERRRSHQLSLDIESATRRSSVLRSDVMNYPEDECIDLSTPQNLTTQDLPSPLVRRDEILTSVAPTTPTDLPPGLKPTTPTNIDGDIEMIGERSLATPVIQLNPNAKGKDHGYR